MLLPALPDGLDPRLLVQPLVVAALGGAVHHQVRLLQQILQSAVHLHAGLLEPGDVRL